MKWNYKIWLVLFVISCKKPYNPPAIAAPNGYLVVEGVINSGSDSTIIKLSKTVKIAAQTTLNPETNASVNVEGNDNSSYLLKETKKGLYSIASLNLSGAHMYRLKIVTSDKSAYQSDFVPLKNSPAIDSITYKVQSNGAQISANTHDPQNQTHYYRWEYNETWLFSVAYESVFEVKHNPDTIVPRPYDSLIYQCWSSDTTSTIVLGSSAKLSQDVIASQPITFVASTSEKFEDLYSIQVKQFALTADAYNYWQQLKTNTQQLGSIFDAEPSETAGNIHCVNNPSEPVIGYVSAGTVATQRIFIDSRKLPAWLPITPYGNCLLRLDLFSDGKNHENDVKEDLYNGYSIPVEGIEPPGSPIIGYTATSLFCGDCRTRGTNIRPSFWPQ
jgi:hypothetical protein